MGLKEEGGGGGGAEWWLLHKVLCGPLWVLTSAFCVLLQLLLSLVLCLKGAKQPLAKQCLCPSDELAPFEVVQLLTCPYVADCSWVSAIHGARFLPACGKRPGGSSIHHVTCMAMHALLYPAAK